jgi:hypothetical protein
MNIPICAFNGIDNPNEDVGACDDVWSQWERDQLAMALDMAEGTLAGQLKFTLGEEYQVSAIEPWTNPMQLEWGYIIGGGVQGLTAVTPTSSDFTVDPAIITVAQSDFPGGVDEVYIIETSTGLEIVPDSISATGVSYVIEIDQCKLIEWGDLEHQVDAIDYDGTFPAAIWLKLADLTVYREYLDVSEQATITYGPTCSCICGTTACAGTDYDGCVFIVDAEISKVKVQMADYDATTETWTCSVPLVCGCYEGDQVSIAYLAGTTSIAGYEWAIIRLAHTYLATKPCGCGLFDFIWARDTNIPSVLTAERVNNPFGLMDGAWFAWQWSETHKHGRAFML